MLLSTFTRVFVAGSLAAMAVTTTALANHSWANYHWGRTSNDLFTLQVGDNVSSSWDAYLGEAAADWTVSQMLDLAVTAGRSNPKNCRPTAGRIEACSSKYGTTGWLGIAQIWVSGDHITQAVTKVNDTYFNTATYNTPAWRRLVMCQEIAHDFGLDHQDETFDNPNLGSCMDYTNDPDGGLGGASSADPSNEHPNQHDYDELVTIYSHVDSVTTIASALPSAMPPAMGQIDFDSPGQWGRLVRSSRNGRVQTFELDFGRGHKIVTHVFWADPDGDAR